MSSAKGPGSPGSQTELKRSPTSGPSASLRERAADAGSTLADAAQQTMDEAKRATSSLASEANEKVKSLLDQQIVAGAQVMSHVADSARIAAQNLDQNVPQLASLVRNAGDRIEEFSREIRGQSAKELATTVSQFARRRPAVVFGMAAACGFLAFRLLNAGSASHTGSASSTDLSGEGTDWRPDPRVAGSPYPISGVTSPGANRPYPDIAPATSPPISPSPGQFHGP